MPQPPMPTLDQIKNLVRDLDADDYHALRLWIVTDETPRREAAPQVEAALAENAEQLWKALPGLKPEYADTEPEPAETVDSLIKTVPAWKQPEAPHSSYPPAALVTHNGNLWRNNRRGLNGKEPGTRFSGWEDVTADFLKPDPIETTPTGPDKPTPEPEPPTPPAPGVKEWKTGDLVAKGDTRTHNGKLYVSTRLHTTKKGWEPDAGTGHWKTLD